MRFGAPVFRFENASQWAKRHIEKGYTAAYWPLGDDAPKALVDEYVQAAKDAGLIIAEVGIWNNTLDPDPAKRQANFEKAVRRLETAEYVCARCCVNVSGSRGPIWDGPDNRNLTEETFDMVVDVAQRLIDSVNPKNTSFTLEPMPWMYPHDENDALALIKAVDRPAFMVHADMANLVNSYDKYIATGDLTRRFFSALGEYIVSVHVKDTHVSEIELTLHIEEALVGTGNFDFAALIECAGKLGRDVPLMLEHLSREEEYDAAAKNLRAIAARSGIAL